MMMTACRLTRHICRGELSAYAAVARDRGSGGTGVGLAITEGAVHMYGGTVAAINETGGLVLQIDFPVIGNGRS